MPRAESDPPPTPGLGSGSASASTSVLESESESGAGSGTELATDEQPAAGDDAETVLVIEGDGIGREVVPAAVRVLEAVADLRTVTRPAGDRVRDERGTPLPAATREAAATADATLFGAVGETAADVILPLRETVGAFANVRPARALPGVDASRPETDLVIVRENTEGVYAGHETRLSEEMTTLTRVVTASASRRIAAFGFAYAAEHGYEEVTITHKANVMQTTDGQFLAAAREAAAEHTGTHDEELIDALAAGLVTAPEEYGVIITPNLAGDVLSDLAAGLVGGLGLAPSANIGPERALFEPVHGSAPDIAGEGIANPVATVLSAALLLEQLGRPAAAEAVRGAVRDTLRSGPRTPDIGGTATTAEMTDAIIDQL